jgi:RimJ/RimL family protein N-acetyltransferase
MAVIRRAIPSDASAFLSFMATAGGESDNLVTDASGLSFTVEKESAYLRSRLESKNCITLLAFEGDALVGCIGCDTSPRARISHIGEIGITVLKAYWGKGIGRDLLSSLIAWAKDPATGIRKLDLSVRSDNERAIALYRKFGFEEEGKISRLMQIDGVFCDGIRMALLVD